MLKKIIAVDIDETLCTHEEPITKISDYLKAKPLDKIIKLTNSLYDNNYIILYTARGALLAGKDANLKKKIHDLTIKQLALWNVKYHELNMDKIYYDLIIDDKSLNPLNNIENYFKN